MALWADDVDIDDDRALVHRFQDGDGRAFDELYGRHIERLRRFCRRRVSDPHLAEEIAQEAFVKALLALPRLTGDRRFYPWLTVIAGRLCIDHHRRSSRIELRDEVDLGAVDGDHGARLDHQIDLDDLEAALARLRPRHREVLDLRERDEMSYAAIAEHLAVPYTTVEALLHRARGALRREFHAVAGGRLAGFPLIGWVSRRLTALRATVADHTPSLAQLAGPVAAGAVAASLALVPPLGGAGTAPPPATVDATAPSAAASPSSASAASLAERDPHPPADTAAPGLPSPSSPGPGPRPPVVTSAEPVPGASVSVGDEEAYGDAADDTRTMPLHTPDGPLLLGVDPDAAVRKIDQKLFGGTP